MKREGTVMKVTNIFEALKVAKKDEAVGIRSIRLSGDDDFAVYGAQIDGLKRIGAHYHTKGNEIYQVIDGEGKMHIGNPKEDGKVEWLEPLEVKTGDCFTIYEGQVHQLENIAPEDLIIIFACPYSHISTDRIVVQR